MTSKEHPNSPLSGEFDTIEISPECLKTLPALSAVSPKDKRVSAPTSSTKDEIRDTITIRGIDIDSDPEFPPVQPGISTKQSPKPGETTAIFSSAFIEEDNAASDDPASLTQAEIPNYTEKGSRQNATQSMLSMPDSESDSEVAKSTQNLSPDILETFADILAFDGTPESPKPTENQPPPKRPSQPTVSSVNVSKTLPENPIPSDKLNHSLSTTMICSPSEDDETFLEPPLNDSSQDDECAITHVSIPTNSEILKAQLEQKGANEELDDPIIRHFEGTNEIFIQSHAFDALREPEETLDNAKTRGFHLIPEKRNLELGLWDDEKNDNVVGIINTGGLPRVDKSKPTIDPKGPNDSIDMAVAGLETLASNEVFVSKLSNKSSNSDTPKVKSVNKLQSKLVIQQEGETCGLPSLNAHGQLHPEDVTKSLSAMPSDQQFAIDHLYRSELCNLWSADVEAHGLHNNLDDIFASFGKSFLSETPCVACFMADSILESSRTIRGFLHLCHDKLQNVTLYTTAIPDDREPYDIVTSLISSRIECFPNAKDEEHKKTIIAQAANELFEKSDLRWGLDILFVRYGLSQAIPAKKDLPLLQARNESDIQELLLNTILQDAKRGPVILVISERYAKLLYPWKDLVRQIQSLKTTNVFILIIRPEDNEIPEGADVIHNNPLDNNDKEMLLKDILSAGKINLPDGCFDMVLQHTENTFSQILKMAHTLKHISAPNEPLNADDLTQWLTEQSDYKDILFDALSEDEQQLLGIASCLGDKFYFEDLVKVLSFEPLPGEIAYIQSERRKWCQKVLETLANDNLILILHRREKLGQCFEIPGREFYQTLMTKRDPALVKRMQGGYALILEKRAAFGQEMAEAACQAQQWSKAIRYWVDIAQKQGHAFCNLSAHALLNKCLKYATPLCDEAYPLLLKACIEQSWRLGEYDQVYLFANRLAQASYVMGNRKDGCDALIWLGSVLNLKGEYEQAQKVLNLAIKQAEDLHNDALLGSAYYTLARKILDCGEKGALVNALRHAEKSLEIRRKSDDLPKISSSLTLCAEIYLMRGEPARAKDAAKEAYQALSASGNWFDMPGALIILAQSAAALGEPLPLDNLERGFAIASKTGDFEQRFHLLEARISLLTNTLQRQNVKLDLDLMKEILESKPLKPWLIRYKLLVAAYDFSRKDFQLATKSLKQFFDTTTQSGNRYLLSLGYELSAEMNFEAYKRKLGKVSLEKTEKLYHNATAIFEAVGAWHKVAETLRHYANFLDYLKRPEDAKEARIRAGKVDPYCQQ